MSWTDPSWPFWVISTASLVGLNGMAALVSVAIERFGLPAGWSIQAAPRKAGQLRRAAPLIAANLSVMVVGSAISFALFPDAFPFYQPSLVESLFVFFGLVLFDDIGFYWLHRVLHTRKEWYNRIHRLHHRSYAPVPIEYIYAHPVEWMTGAMFPILFVVGVIAVQGGINAWLFLAWVCFRQIHEMDIHSGTRSWIGDYIPFWGTTAHHDLHHARPNAGNYASTLTFWDYVFGTRVTAQDLARPRRPSPGEPSA